MEFVELERITGEAIGNAIIKFYNELVLNWVLRAILWLRCKYSVSEKSAASYVLKESPKAIVTHCSSHNLNLPLASSCKLPEIDNISKTYKAITIFFNSSPKRKGLLDYIEKQRFWQCLQRLLGFQNKGRRNNLRKCHH